jgi:hypothetical protein
MDKSSQFFFERLVIGRRLYRVPDPDDNMYERTVVDEPRKVKYWNVLKLCDNWHLPVAVQTGSFVNPPET